MNIESPNNSHPSETEDTTVVVDETGGEAKSSRGWIIAVVLLFVVVLAGTIFFLMGSGETAGEGAAEGELSDQAPRITVMRAGSDTVTRDINATGTFAARREVSIGVVGEGGRVTQVLTDEGQWVKKGQLLVVIDRSVQVQQIEGLRAQVAARRADLQLAQNELDRALALVDRGFISKADVDRKRATRDGAQANLRAAQASLAENQARTARLNVYAPSNGYILTRTVEPGSVVNAGSPLFTMAEGGSMELQAKLSEEDLARVSVGISATVVPVGTDVELDGRIWQIAPVIEENSRQGIARIAVPFSQQIRPGGFASATIRAGAVTAPVLPESAVLTNDEGSYVLIVGKENKVVRRSVKTGLVTANGVAVESGLSGNELVVLRAGAFLNEGEKIRPDIVKNADVE